MAKTTKTNTAYTLGFNAGQGVALSVLEGARALGDILTSVKTPEQYAGLRAEWVKGYAAGYGCAEGSAQRAWTRAATIAGAPSGFKKPQSDRAKAVQAARANSTAPKTPTGAPKALAGDDAGDPINPAPAVGVEAATRMVYQLDKNEAHLISLIRQKKYSSVVEFMRAIIASQ